MTKRLRWLSRHWILAFTFAIVVGTIAATPYLLERMKGHDDAITAISTVVIAAFTIVLGLAAYYQYHHAREVDRAYLTVGGDLELLPPSPTQLLPQPAFRLEIENIGRSAAFITSYDIHFTTTAQVLRPQPARSVNEQAEILDDRLGPAGSNHSSFKKIKTGKVRTNSNDDIVYGAVWYTDIWQKPHHTRFILSIHQDGHTRPNVGNVDDEYRRRT